MKRLFTLLTAVIITAMCYSQAPSKFSYQAVVRNSGGVLVQSSPVGIKISILQGSAAGSAIYAETHTITTNVNGLASLEIGGGTPVSGTFANIDWSAGLYFLKTETDPAGGTSYTISGTSQLLSIPYALYSKKAELLQGTTGMGSSSGLDADLLDGLHSSEFIRSETDPLWSAASIAYYTKSSIDAGFAQISHTHADATTLVSGFLSGDDKTKLAGIAAGAEINVNADWNAIGGDALILNKPSIPINTSQLTNDAGFISSYTETDPVFSNLFNISALANNQLLKYNSGSGKWENWTSDFITGFTEADPIWTAASVNYYTKSQTDVFLASHPHADATTTISGFLSGADKTKLDGLQNADGSETKLVSGTNVLVSGAGTTGSPYIVNAIGSGWILTGNAGTVDGTNFIGTTDNVPFNIRVNNQKAGRIDNTNQNTFFGYLSGNAISSGSANTAIGKGALETNILGNGNTAIGSGALNTNKASYNTSNGYQSLYYNTTGGYNTAVGNQTLQMNSTGGNNTAVGFQALFYNSTVSNNTAIGYRALLSNTTGAQNTALGFQAGDTETPSNANTTGSNNTFIGYNSGPGTSAQLTNATAVGYKALVTANNSLVLGGTGAEAVKVGIGVTAPSATLDVLGNVKIVDGTQGAGKILTSDVNGLASWTSNAHFIGESYGGGIVFYVYDNGQHGLIAASADQGTSITWYNGTLRHTSTQGDGLGAGSMNTAMIIAIQLNDNQNGNFAARVCADYSVTDNGITYGDWYLPSKYELNLLYLQKNVVGGFTNNWYWSSTEGNDFLAWDQNFDTGSQVDDGKLFPTYVRAIRSF